SRIAEQVEAHGTTLVFVNTRRLAERLPPRLPGADGAGGARGGGAAAAGGESRRGAGGGAPRQPVEGAPPARRGSPPRGRAARARGDGLARARHRHRTGRGGVPDGPPARAGGGA